MKNGLFRLYILSTISIVTLNVFSACSDDGDSDEDCLYITSAEFEFDNAKFTPTFSYSWNTSPGFTCNLNYTNYGATNGEPNTYAFYSYENFDIYLTINDVRSTGSYTSGGYFKKCSISITDPGNNTYSTWSGYYSPYASVTIDTWTMDHIKGKLNAKLTRSGSSANISGTINGKCMER